MSQIDRRDFLKTTGSLVLSFSLLGGAASRVLAQGALPGSLATAAELDAWIRINPDSTATVFTGKVEIGQGIQTALAQIAAEELDLNLDRVEMITGDTALTPDESYTAGSLSIENSGGALRAAAAEVRSILLDLAARALGRPKAQLEVYNGLVTPRGLSAPSISYGELFGDQKFARKATNTVKPKGYAYHRVVGNSYPRRDIPAKIFGGVAYVHDYREEGMLFGGVLRPPRYGAVLEQLNLAEAEQMPGVVRVLRDGSYVGVVAEREEQVAAVINRLRASATWKGGAQLPSSDNLAQYIKSLPKEDVVGRNQGKVDEAIAGAARLHSATYLRPYQAHASLGPSAAVARWDDGKLEVRSHTQGSFPLRRDLAKVLAVPLENIRVIHMEGAGCYGHNGADDAALDAALLSRAVDGRPVKVIWSREEETGWEPYGAAMLLEAKAGLDANGNIVAWDYQVWGDVHNSRPGGGTAQQSNLLSGWYLANPVLPPPKRDGQLPSGGADRNALPLYDFPNVRVVKHTTASAPIRVSALRGLGAYGNVFALESFIDELSYIAGADPVEFRLRHMKEPRARAVIEDAARLARWTPKTRPSGSGQGRGVAFARYKNSAAYMALVVDVSVDRATGVVTVQQAYASVDAGLCINPDGILNQVEGGIVQSTSWTLKEEVQFGSQGIASVDWASYPILGFLEVPNIEISLINRPPEATGGVGEVAQGPTVAAIVNAVYDATGVRIRQLPLTPARVKAALAKG